MISERGSVISREPRNVAIAISACYQLFDCIDPWNYICISTDIIIILKMIPPAQPFPTNDLGIYAHYAHFLSVHTCSQKQQHFGVMPFSDVIIHFGDPLMQLLLERLDTQKMGYYAGARSVRQTPDFSHCLAPCG